MGGYQKARELRPGIPAPLTEARSFSVTDVAVVGAGAAGLMAAIAAARAGGGRLQVTLLDSREKIGAKILISGGTRCNVTNRRVEASDYQGATPHFIRHVLEAFNPQRTLSFFSDIGVPLVLEPSGKYFPQTHSGRTVLEALKSEVLRVGARLVTGARVVRVDPGAGGFALETEQAGVWKARRVVLATGGLSLPETGSDGTGLRLARELGHATAPTWPALTPLETTDPGWTALSGITLPVRLSLYLDGKKAAQTQDSFLFTHFGYSGPAALDLSRHWAAAPTPHRRVEASFLPQEDDASLRGHFTAGRSAVSVKRFLIQGGGFPERLVEEILRRARVPESHSLARLSSAQREALIQALLHADLRVTGVVGYKKAEVTAGGVDAASVRQATLESRTVPGLHFCGEILDVDGRIGGFNFQWAWSSGWVAGSAAAQALL